MENQTPSQTWKSSQRKNLKDEFPIETQERRPIVRTPVKVGDNHLVWSPDSKTLAFWHNDREARYY
ncbi:MAG: hypothetical protein KME06_00865 [Kastovskya adunca ATA6-11-RM4]|nr:hypothetical protein [Kastovskya adunca ATA6-11-RM4]